MRVLVFGASITQGFWDTEGGWVQRLRRFYDEQKVKDIKNEGGYPDIFNLGVSADTSKDVVNRLDIEVSARRRNEMIIVFCVGTNNAMTDGSNNWPGVDPYKEDLRELVSKAHEFTDKIIFVGLAPCVEAQTTPVFWGEYYYTNERIKLVEQAMSEVALDNNILFVPIFNSMKEKMDAGSDLFADGLHPNNDGHQLIFELVRPELKKYLTS
jgi:lysophospholipase L1-like esterase